MLTALVLCTQLMAAKMVADCKAVNPGLATFRGPDGHGGALLMPKADRWDDAVAVASAADAGAHMVAASAWANVILVTETTAPQLTWWASTVDTLCEATAARIDLKAQIAREKANPSGVVDLRRLHDLGERLQSAEDALRDSGAAYSKGVGKPFSADVCKATP